MIDMPNSLPVIQDQTWRAARRFVSVIAVALAASGCAAGHIEPLSKPVKAVEVGLSDHQIELRVQSDALRRAPWTAETAASGGFTVGRLLGVLVDGMGPGAGTADTPAAGALAAGSSGTLSSGARQYLAKLETEGSQPADRLARVETDLAGRVDLTRRFVSAASHVVAAHRVSAPTGAGTETAQEDLRLIRETLAALRTQRATFEEVIATLRDEAGQRPAAKQSLEAFTGEIASLEILKQSVALDSLS